ncbi:hypothetical protein ACLOJK_001173 [Asimina triloba]
MPPKITTALRNTKGHSPTISALKLCVLMLDICEDLVPEMFKVFFSAVRECLLHPLGLLLLSYKVVRKGFSPSTTSKLTVLSSVLRLVLIAILFLSLNTGVLFSADLTEFATPMALPAYSYTDQVDVRIKAVHLVAKLFAVSGCRFGHEYNQLFVEFLKRFSDKSVDVRVSAVECCKICHTANPSGTEAFELLTALEGRLLDFDDKVRTQAVNTVCDLAQSNLRYVQAGLLLKAMDRLRDKKVSVRRNAMQKLLELYRLYCTKCSDDLLTQSDHLEEIPCRILALCFDKDCKDFRPQNMELVLADDLFPATLSIEERTKHWISVFSIFTTLHMKALNSILSQKRRLQMEMQAYLDLRRKQKQNSSEDARKKVSAFFVKMSTSFVDHSKAEESFQELHQMKDNSIFISLQDLVNERTPSLTAQTTRRPSYHSRVDLQLVFQSSGLASHCGQHVGDQIIPPLRRDMFRDVLTDSSFGFLSFKALYWLRQALTFLSNSVIDCIRGKNQWKVDVPVKILGPGLAGFIRLIEEYDGKTGSAADVNANLKLSMLADFVRKLVDSLFAGRNVSTVLQSLGYIAQYCRALYESQEDEITQFIIQKLFRTTDVINFDPQFVRVEIDKDVVHGIESLLRKLKKGHFRLAAAKSVLQLARRWDLYLTPHVFHLTVMQSRDPKSYVRKSFLEKVHKLLKERAIPMRYACSFALAASDCLQEIREDAMKYLAEFIKEYGREARISQNLKVQDSGQMMTNFPEYVVVYLVHVLAHDLGFPSDECKDENAYARFCSPLVVIIQVLLKAQSVGGYKCDVGETVLYLLSIFRAIKKAEDAVDICMTPKLHFLSNIGSLIMQEISHTGISLSRTPGRVLLPSSFYRIRNDTKGDKPSGPHGKHVKIATEESMLSDKKPAIKNLPLKQKTVTPISNTREGREDSYVLGRGLEKIAREQFSAKEKHQSVSPSDPKPVQPIHPAPTVDNVAIGAPRDAETNPEKDMVSSCGSAVIKVPVSLVSPEVEAPCMPPENCSLETTKKRTMTEPTTLAKSSSEVNCSSKEVIDATEVLPGNRIKLWSPIDKRFYTGTIKEFDSQNSIHKLVRDLVACDDGDVELLCLANEHWEAIGDSLLSMVQTN